MKIFCSEKSVGAVVFRREEQGIKYLVLQYGRGRSHWSLPKGHIEEKEMSHETLDRELKEETGICQYKIIDNFAGSIRYFYVARGEEKKFRIKNCKGIAIFKKVLFYLVETECKDVILSHEHSDFAWLSFDEAVKRITFKKDRKIFKKAHDFLTDKP